MIQSGPEGHLAKLIFPFSAGSAGHPYNSVSGLMCYTVMYCSVVFYVTNLLKCAHKIAYKCVT